MLNYINYRLGKGLRVFVAGGLAALVFNCGKTNVSDKVPQETKVAYNMLDSDNDGIPNYIEERYGLDPYNADSDNDGLMDGSEGVSYLDNNIRMAVKEFGELYKGHGINPKDFDTDDDGIGDGVENGLGKPETDDTDLDVFVADEDPLTETDPLNPDSDGDGLKDGEEDFDYNGKRDLNENNPNNIDSDNDGFTDGYGIAVHPLNPNDTTPPLAKYTATPLSGKTPLEVSFDSSGSFDPESGIAEYYWDFDNDMVIDSNEKNPVFVYRKPGNFLPKLIITNGAGLYAASHSLEVIVNEADLNYGNFSNLDITNPLGLAYGGGRLWVSDEVDRGVYKVNPSSGLVEGFFKGPGGDKVHGICWDGNNLWIAQYPNGMIHKIDADKAILDGVVDNAIITSFGGLGSYVQGITFDGSNLWVSLGRQGAFGIYKMDVKGNILGSFNTSFIGNIGDLEWVDGFLLGTMPYDQGDKVYKIDTNKALLNGNVEGGIVDVFSKIITLKPMTNKIAFHSNRDGLEQIYLMDSGGSNVTRLTNDLSSYNVWPSWSRDGNNIVFQSTRDAGNREIYKMNFDGSNQVRLTNNPGLDLKPSWSPDGNEVIFYTDRDGNQEIYKMNSDGSNQVNLTNHSSGDSSPSWSIGNKIAFVSNRDGNSEIYIMNADGSGLMRLTDNIVLDAGPVWSPDGTKIAFDSDRDGGNSEIYIMNADSGNQIRLTNNGATDYAPSFSYDGSELAFLSNRDSNYEVYKMNSDGSNQIRLTNNGAIDDAVAWSPVKPNYALSVALDEFLNLWYTDRYATSFIFE